MKEYLKIISIRQGSEPYLNMAVRNVGSDDIDDNDGGGVGDGDDDDDDEKFPARKYWYI